MDRRKQGRLHRHEVPAENALEYLPAPQVDQTVHDRQLVRSVLSRLTPDQREILLLRHNWGFTFKEIGAVLGIRETTAKLRAFRAGRTFRSILEAQNVTLEAAEANEPTG
jgi:DNA-directed RNA polymerase specialized sigma24 family protein